MSTVEQTGFADGAAALRGGKKNSQCWKTGGEGPSVSLGDASAGESADDEWIYRFSVETRPGTFWAHIPHAGEIKPPLSNQGIR